MRKLSKLLLGLLVGVTILTTVVPCFASGKDTYTKLLLHENGADTATKMYDSGNYLEGDTDKTVASLHFDGADAATSTTNAGTDTGAITFAGTAQIDTAQSKFGGSSLLCDGNSDYVYLPDSANWDLPGDFTIDGWFNFTANNVNQDLFGNGYDGGWMVEYLSNGRLGFYVNSACNVVGTAGTFTPSASTWYHIAVCRVGTNVKIYVNGTQHASGTEATSITSNNELFIGRDHTDTAYFGGWIDDFRIVKGKALWTANFTAPTVSPSPKDVTAVGTAQIDTSNHPLTFVGTAQIDTARHAFATDTASLLLDGNSDYITAPDSADWYFGSGNFTIDCWVNMSALPGLDSTFYIVGQADTATDQRSWQIYVYTTAGGGHGWTFVRSSDGKSGTTTSSSFADNSITTDTWYHIAVVRSGNDFKFFRDGTQIGSTVDLTGFTFHNSTVTLVIGSAYGGGAYFNGWIDELRIVNGSAVWTEDFTPSTTPYTAQQQANTVLLCHFDGTDGATTSVDSSAIVFGTGSGLFDGNSDYLTLVDSDDWNFGSGDFTVDMWIRFNSVAASQFFCTQGPDGDNEWEFYWIQSTAQLFFNVASSASNIITTNGDFSPSVNTWYHIAVVRNGTNFALYVDGTKVNGTYTDADSIPDFAGSLYIGSKNGATAGTYLNGWIDEFRISKGIARWTSDFTPPTKEYDTTSDYSGQAIVITQ